MTDSDRDHVIDRIAEAMQNAYETTVDDLWTAHDVYAVMAEGGARGMPLNGEAFLHPSRMPLPLAPIDRKTRRENAEDQYDLFEDGDPDGCSPWGCRSGEPE